MKFNYFTLLIIFIGISVLFFFPEPETNFLAYVVTALFFIISTIFSIAWKKKKNKSKVYKEN